MYVSRCLSTGAAGPNYDTRCLNKSRWHELIGDCAFMSLSCQVSRGRAKKRIERSANRRDIAIRFERYSKCKG
ncbi:hypothetical protein M378DRAFT_165377 [Amanita muscaria Koide BX008]|uniref:Uncharacterized protein n=1 Tax=Amanita muscaria (strain Koide BX008) TaxID=946122 RepID=A0A0C2SHS6_AMAMK|nr:hypothetical protein M378DRAFT_165377 [Amanita muscaria Koide BX008]